MAIGRASANAVCLPDPSVSCRHCSLEREPDGSVKIRDLGSCNGTFVEGLPVRERVLRGGEEIRVGCSIFLFVPEEVEPGEARRCVPGTGAQGDLTKPGLITEEILCGQIEQLLEAPRILALPGAALATLLKVSIATQQAGDGPELARRLMSLLAEAIPADHAALWFGEADPQRCRQWFWWQRDESQPTPLLHWNDSVRESLAKGAALLFHRGDAPARVPQGDSSSPVYGSALAAPLYDDGDVLGGLYVSSTDPHVVFHGNHLCLVAAAGLLGGTALARLARTGARGAGTHCLGQAAPLMHDMVGESPAMKAVFAFIAKVAPTDSTVLLSGESGTGKELVARALHANSRRAAGPFLAINCAALPETLLESQLFGHEKGAFTGAIAQKKGMLEAARAGTVLLDEVGDLPPACQAKLLRVLQERQMVRLGGSRSIPVDIRVIAATNRDLRAEVEANRFREDLYYRLAVISLTLPPLRERREDIPLLAAYFASQLGQRVRGHPVELSPAAKRCLLAYEWPGNVRELENAIEHAVVLGATDSLLPEDLPEAVLEAAPASEIAGTYRGKVRSYKCDLIRKALERAAGNVTNAANALGVHPNYLHRLMRNLGVRAPGNQCKFR